MPVWWERVRHLLSMSASTHDGLPDLRSLESTRVRVMGTHFRVHDPERGAMGDRLYVLRRESRGRHASAIAVFAEGRNIGYVPVEPANRLAPLLDRLGGAALVNGLGTSGSSIRLWIDLPDEAALHRYVQTRPPS